MPSPLAIPDTFSSIQSGETEDVRIVPREDLDWGEVATVLEAVSAVRWEELWHAYGPADDVSAQLIAAAVGDDSTREAAWWNLFGNIHHQGTIYEATVPTLPIIGRLAQWRSYPDRVQAIIFLTQVSRAEGVVVWRYGSDGDITHDEARQESLSAEVEGWMKGFAASFLSDWEKEAEPIKRTSLLLLAYAGVVDSETRPMVERQIPDRFRRAWSLAEIGVSSEEEFDEVCEFEDWVDIGD